MCFTQRSRPAVAGLILAAIALASGCRNAPVTHRKQLLLVPEGQEMDLGALSYQEILEKEPLSTNSQYVDLVNRVGRRIANAANKPDYQWEFHVIASDQKNAFCLPGGKVAVYEGILPICEDEAGLAVVMSHEIAHALARHGGERMSQQMMTNAASVAIQEITRKREQYDRELVQQAYGVASEYGVLLPFSRKHETEADRIGLMLMAKAGYDPNAAPAFWDRFAAASQGAEQPPEFFSTHPTDERRSADLRKALPDAIAAYSSAPEQIGFGQRIAAAPPQNSPPPPRRF